MFDTILSTETVKSSALSLKSVDDVEGSDGLSLSVLSVGNRVTDDVLELLLSAFDSK